MRVRGRVFVVVSRKTGLKIFQKYPPNEWYLYLWFFIYRTTNAGISHEFLFKQFRFWNVLAK